MAKQKYCRHCRSLIDRKAKVCPFCRKKQGESCGGTILFFLIFIIGFVAVFDYLMKDPTDKKPDNSEIQVEAEQYSESDYKAACSQISYEEIARSKNGCEGRKLTFTGEVIQVSSELYRLNVTKTSYGYTDTIAFDINTSTLTQNILEGDVVTIWGESKGLYTYKSILNTEVTVPRIRAIYLENHGKQN